MKVMSVELQWGRFPSMIPVPDGKGSWITLTGFHVDSERVGIFFIPAGTWNDLASIPKIVRSVISVNGPHRIAAMVHDYLYLCKGQAAGEDGEPRRPITREEADALFYDIMRMPKSEFYKSYNPYMQSLLEATELDQRFKSDKPLVGLLTARTMYRAVRMGGWVSWRKEPKYPHLLATTKPKSKQTPEAKANGKENNYATQDNISNRATSVSIIDSLQCDDTTGTSSTIDSSSD